MFKRIKNLLELSKYTVEELQNPKYVVKGDFPLSTINHGTMYNPALIVDLQGTNPFDEYETSEQSSNDTTTRNG
jgi:hypothetical protein